MSAASAAQQRILGWDRRVILASLCALAVLCWVYLFVQNWSMSRMDPALMAEPSTSAWGAADVLLLLAMWIIMMAAMMLPAATPTLLLFAQVNRLYHAGRKPYLRTAQFLSGYLAIWGAFSLLASAAQWTLHQAQLMTDMMAITDSRLGAATLIGAGLYQWTPLKHSCLHHCRAPLTFVLIGWKPGNWGAFRMGITHGAYCAGCCWLLMALLFVAGVMNLAWIVGLSVLVLIEKLLPKGMWIARGAGLALVAWGAAMLIR